MRRRCSVPTRHVFGSPRAKEGVPDPEAPGTDLFFVLHGQVRIVIAAARRDVILRGARDGGFSGGERRRKAVAPLDRGPAARDGGPGRRSLRNAGGISQGQVEGRFAHQSWVLHQPGAAS